MANAPISSSSLSIGTTTRLRAPAGVGQQHGAWRTVEVGLHFVRRSAMCSTCFVDERRPSPVSGRGRIDGSRRRSSANAGGGLCIAADGTRLLRKTIDAKSRPRRCAVAFSSMALKDRLQLARRTGDDLKHLRGRSLLFLRFTQLAGALIELCLKGRNSVAAIGPGLRWLGVATSGCHGFVAHSAAWFDHRPPCLCRPIPSWS